MEEKRTTGVWVVAALLMTLLLPSLYAATYWLVLGVANLSVAGEKTVRFGRSPTYHVREWPPYGSDAHDWLELAFSPAHCVDARLRPEYWALGEPKQLPANYDPEVDDLWALQWDENGELTCRGGVVDSSPTAP